MAARVVIGTAIVGLLVAGIIGLRLVTADSDDHSPQGGVVEVPGGEATQGTVGDLCPPSTRALAKQAVAAMTREYRRTYGAGPKSPFREAKLSDRLDIDDFDHAFVVLGIVAPGDESVERVACYRHVQVVWSPAGVLPHT